MTIRESIESIQHGEVYAMRKDEAPFAEVWRIHDTYVVFITRRDKNGELLYLPMIETKDSAIERFENWSKE